MNIQEFINEIEIIIKEFIKEIEMNIKEFIKEIKMNIRKETRANCYRKVRELVLILIQ